VTGDRRVDPDAARDLLVDLVSTPSPSGEEAACAERLASFLREHGREARLDAAGNVRAPGDDGALLTSHVDTVPGDLPAYVEDGVLHGRGSVDATGPLAALAVAAVETGATFAGVVGEEADSRGARHLIEAWDRDPPGAVVNGEPSGWDAITLGYRGMLAGRYRASTESTHASRPSANAVQHAIRWWSRVEAAFAPAGDDPDAPVVERVTATPTAVEGGLDGAGRAVEATLDAQLRVPVGGSVADVRERAEAELDAGAVEWTDAVPPVMVSPRTPLAGAFRAAIRASGGEPSLLRKTGTSDMNLYAGAWDCPMVTYGPGDSALDHAPDERLPLSAFDRSVEVLCAAVGRAL